MIAYTIVITNPTIAQNAASANIGDSITDIMLINM